MYNKINLVLNKLADYSSMDQTQRKDFIDNAFRGLSANLISDGSNLVPENLANEVKDSPSEENVKDFLMEMEKTDEGLVVINSRVMELLESILMPVVEQLNTDQKEEIFSILVTK